MMRLHVEVDLLDGDMNITFILMEIIRGHQLVNEWHNDSTLRRIIQRW